LEFRNWLGFRANTVFHPILSNLLHSDDIATRPDMKIKRSILLITILLSGCGEKKANVFALTPAQVYEKLSNEELKDFRFRSQCGLLIHIRPDGIRDKSITWRVYSSGQEMVSFTANLTPLADDSTKITYDVSKDPDGREAYSGVADYKWPAFHQPLRPRLEEGIAAILENRPYNIKRISDQLEQQDKRLAENDRSCDLQRAGLEAGNSYTVNGPSTVGGHTISDPDSAESTVESDDE